MTSNDHNHTDSDTAARARRLLDAYPEDVFTPPREGWKAGSVTGTVPNPDDEDGYDDVWITPDAFAAHVLRTIALPVITDLLAEVDRWRWAAVDAERQCDELEAERDAAVARADTLASATPSATTLLNMADNIGDQWPGYARMLAAWAAAGRGTDR